MVELFACDGPGADEATARNVQGAYLMATLVGGQFLIALILMATHWRQRTMRYAPAILLILLVFNPAWIVSVDRGDCGTLRANMSFIVMLLGSAVLGVQQIMLLWYVWRWLGDYAKPKDAATEGTT